MSDFPTGRGVCDAREQGMLGTLWGWPATVQTLFESVPRQLRSAAAVSSPRCVFVDRRRRGWCLEIRLAVRETFENLEHAFCTWNRIASGIGFGRHSNGSCDGFENAFGDVMRVPSVVQDDVQIAICVRSERLPKVFDQFAVEGANFVCGNRGVIFECIAASEIDC